MAAVAVATKIRQGRPSREEAEQLTRRILEGAILLFAEVGFAAATVETLADRVGTMRKSIYHRFPTKEDLLVAAHSFYRDRERRLLVDLFEPQGANIMETLRKALHSLLFQALSQPSIGLFRVTTSEASRIPELSKGILAFSDDLEAAVSRLIVKAQHEGRFQHHSAAALATAAIGLMLSNPINRAVLGDDELRRADAADLYFSQAWAVFLAAA